MYAISSQLYPGLPSHHEPKKNSPHHQDTHASITSIRLMTPLTPHTRVLPSYHLLSPLHKRSSKAQLNLTLPQSLSLSLSVPKIILNLLSPTHPRSAIMPISHERSTYGAPAAAVYNMASSSPPLMLSFSLSPPPRPSHDFSLHYMSASVSATLARAVYLCVRERREAIYIHTRVYACVTRSRGFSLCVYSLYLGTKEIEIWEEKEKLARGCVHARGPLAYSPPPRCLRAAINYINFSEQHRE